MAEPMFTLIRFLDKNIIFLRLYHSVGYTPHTASISAVGTHHKMIQVEDLWFICMSVSVCGYAYLTAPKS